MNFLLRLLRHWPILLLAIWFGGMTILLDRAVDLFAKRTTPNLHDLSAPAPWRHSRLFVDPDAYVWLSYARDLRASPHFRIRWTHMDNVPHGRPVHWAQLPIWSLCAIAAALETTGIPYPDSLELAGRVLLPLLGFLSFSALWLFLRRSIPPGLAALVVLSLAIMLFWDFHPLRPDHHGFHLAVAAAVVLPLLFSSFGFAPPSFRNRLPFLISGAFGGVALWLGATVFCFTLVAVALAAALALFPRRSSADSPLDSAVWRVWGLAGCLSALFLYLLEYAPNHFSMRLEANHPVYAISFLGIGECIHLLARLRHDPATRPSPRFLLHTTAALAVAVLPSLVLFGPAAWYIPRSTLMLRLHARHIQEFRPLHVLCAEQGDSFPFVLILRLLPALAALPFLLRRPIRRPAIFAMAILAIFIPLYLWQNRWELFVVLYALLPVLAVQDLNPPAAPALQRNVFLSIALLIPLSIALWHNLAPLPAYFRGTSFDPAALFSFQCRALATQFRPALAASDATPHSDAPALLAPADLAPYFWYYARIPSVASYYWENLPGFAAAAVAFADSAPDAPTARAIAESRHLSHLLVFEGARDAMLYDDLHAGIFSRDHAARTLAGILSGAAPGTALPSWLGVDPALNRLANPPLFTWVPPARRFVTHPFALRIYSLRPDS